MFSFLFSVLIVASALGSIQALVLLSHRHDLPPLDAVLVFVYCWISYALVSAAVALCWRIVKRSSTESDSSGVEAVGIAIGTFIAVCALWKLAQLRQSLFWLIPACAIYGVPAGWIAFRLAQRIRWLRAPMFWNAVNAICLFAGLAIVFLPRDVGPSVANANGPRPNVVLISIDTLRADHLGCYGYKNAITPDIDRFARGSVLFEQAISQIPLTGPSHASMLTGMYPRRHGVIGNSVQLSARAVTLSEILSSAGYSTAAFVSGWPLKDSESAFDKHFQFYDDNFSASKVVPDAVFSIPLVRLLAVGPQLLGHRLDPLRRAARLTSDRVIDWVSENHQKPFFLFVHYYDPHGPYTPPPPFDKLHDPNYTGDTTTYQYLLPAAVRRQMTSNPKTIQHILSQYDGMISYLDSQVGRLLETLDQYSPNSLIIFTADHGESMTEHNVYFDHGEYLYDTCLHVPLIIRMPDRSFAGSRHKSQVRLIDLAPTILEIAGLKPPGSIDGQTLMPVLRGPEQDDRPAFASVHAGRNEDRRSRYALRLNGYKLIFNFDLREELSSEPGFEEFYDLNQDPGETRNLSQQQPAIIQEMRKKLHDWMPGNSVMLPELTPEQQERLHALGYL